MSMNFFRPVTKRLALGLAMISLFHAGALLSAEPGGNIAIKIAGGSTQFVYESPQCEVTWELIAPQATLLNSMHCPVALAELADIQAQLLDTVVQHFPKPLLRIYWGKITQHKEHTLRFVQAVHEVAASNEPGLINPDDIMQAIDDHAVFAELQRIFVRHNMRLKVDEMKNMLIQRVSKTPVYDRLKERGFNPRQIVPYDAEIGFEVTTITLDTVPH